jgi:hypothetical protein
MALQGEEAQTNLNCARSDLSWGDFFLREIAE